MILGLFIAFPLGDAMLLVAFGAGSLLPLAPLNIPWEWRPG